MVPVFEEFSFGAGDEDEDGGEDGCEDGCEDDSPPVEILDEDGELVLRGLLGDAQLVYVWPLAIDSERTALRFSWLAGALLGDIGMQTLLMGTLLEPSFFHVQADIHLGSHGQMMIGCDLVVRRDDEPLIRQRIGELLNLAASMEWFFPVRMPNRLRWTDLRGLEIPWEELPHGELEEFLDTAMEAPPSERTPRALIRIAQGLSRWKDVLRLLREHPEEFSPVSMAPLKAMACRELDRWLPAIEAATEGGLEDGYYVGGPWLSPSYMHALIEVGKDIEALSLLGQSEDFEPGFYDWLRGLALHRVGDHDGAETAFTRYFDQWPGDVIGIATTQALVGE